MYLNKYFPNCLWGVLEVDPTPCEGVCSGCLILGVFLAFLIVFIMRNVCTSYEEEVKTKYKS
jgi:hypothetical protein